MNKPVSTTLWTMTWDGKEIIIELRSGQIRRFKNTYEAEKWHVGFKDAQNCFKACVDLVVEEAL